jgi:hypothetical protein
MMLMMASASFSQRAVLGAVRAQQRQAAAVDEASFRDLVLSVYVS